MKRDIDLIRKLMLTLEKQITLQPKMFDFTVTDEKIIIDCYSDEEVYFHLVMLLESPFVEGSRYLGGHIRIDKITWNGREFLDAVRGENVWAKTKAGAEKIGGVGLGFVWEIAKGVIKHEIKTLGLDAT